MPLPWALRRRALNTFFNHDISPTASIGLSVFLCKKVIMEAGARIGHFSLFGQGLHIQLGEDAFVGHLNWVGGLGLDSTYFAAERDRFPALVLARGASITSRHFLDCTNTISIGEFSTVAGWASQLITHGIKMSSNIQQSASISIGKYCMVGSRATILKGATLPDYSALGAGSVLHRPQFEAYTLYSGCPALPVATLDPQARYFSRTNAWVD
jgi:acetyltransferase-like isoleucine patch superfamily enzyme